MRSAIYMLRKTGACFILSGAAMVNVAYAIEIEQRPLSTSTQPAVATKPEPEPKFVAAPAPAPVAPIAPAKVDAPIAPKASPAPVNPAWDMFQQLEEMRAIIATLQGSVEEQQQLIERLQSDLRSRYTDLDQRLEQLAKPAPAVSLNPEPLPPSEPETPVQNVPESANGTVVIPSKPKIELSNEEIEKQKTAYLAAYQSFRREGALPAIQAMQNFLEKFPESVFAPNAHYWLGEFQLATEPANFTKAAASFQRVINDYSASPKVASSYYKLGTIADLQGDKVAAKNWMAKLLNQFPGSPEARLAQSFLDQNPAK